jgi:dTDP-glucose 4,6-dehydratase
MSKKTYVITGGAGFIGSHLCDAIIKRGHRVICIDNFITGNINNIKHLLHCPDFKLMEHDVTKYIKIRGRVDYILHFASPASPADYIKYPIQTLKVGALGTHNALGLAKKHNAVFLLASTSEVYGDPLVHPQKETYWGNVNPTGIRGVYDEAKRFAEAITLAYHRYHGLNTRIVRIFNTYGERMRINDGRAIPNFIFQALSGKDITVYGNGSQTRSFCYISDLVKGILKLLNKKYHYPVNLGNPSEMTLLELAKTIIKLTGSKSKIKFKKLPEDDPKVRKPDISLAKRLLKWEPEVHLEEGLKRTIEYFRQAMMISEGR